MRKVLAGLLLLLGLASPALAQTKFTMPAPGGVTVVGVQVVATCGAASGLSANNLAYLAMDTTGVLCTSVSGGGITAAVTVADGADVAEGSTTSTAATAGGTGSVSAKLRLMTTQLGTINTTLGSPFQAGGSIANTSFGATQATAANLNATVVGTGTFATQSTLAAETTKVIGTVNQGTSPWVTSGTSTVSGTITANQGTSPWIDNISQINGVTPLMGNGTTGTGSQRVTIASDNTAFTVNAAQATAASLNATVVGTGTFAVQAQPTPVTSGGLSVYFVQPTASDNHVVIKAGAGQVYKISVTNNSATVNYLRLYNATTGFNGCNSATNLVYENAIPASTSVGGLADQWDAGMAFATGISICVTSGYATNDTTNATASAMNVNIGYK